MKAVLGLLVMGTILFSTSCIVWIAQPVASYERDSWVMIESDTEWRGEIDGWHIHGHGDRTYYLDADCVSVENLNRYGFIRATLARDGCHPVTSYSDAAYGSVWVCD